MLLTPWARVRSFRRIRLLAILQSVTKTGTWFVIQGSNTITSSPWALITLQRFQNLSVRSVTPLAGLVSEGKLHQVSIVAGGGWVKVLFVNRFIYPMTERHNFLFTNQLDLDYMALLFNVWLMLKKKSLIRFYYLYIFLWVFITLFYLLFFAILLICSLYLKILHLP